MPREIVRDHPLSWRQVAAVAEGAGLSLSQAARWRVDAARDAVDSIIARNIPASGVNTGIGALGEVVVDPSQLKQLSRNIVMSHAVGVGAAFGRCEVRAVIAAAVNNFAHGLCGLRAVVIDRLLALLTYDCLPEVPTAGSAGYLTHMAHMAHIALALVGEGHVHFGGVRRPALEALKALNLEPLTLEAKEGSSLVNGAPGNTGLTAVALLRTERLLNWADVVAAMTFENLHGQPAAFDQQALALRVSPAVSEVGERLRSLLEGSAILAAWGGRLGRDAPSLLAVPHVHGAARDIFARTIDVVDDELASATDNTLVLGSREAARTLLQADSVSTAIGLSADALGVAVAELAALSQQRIDQLLNPHLSGLPAFLTPASGAGSGFMIAQGTAASLAADTRRLAAPASLEAGIAVGTPAPTKLLAIIDNAEFILAIELLASAQGYDLQTGELPRAPNTDIVYQVVRSKIPHYRDDRPLAGDVERVRELIRLPTAVDFDPPIEARDPLPPARSRRRAKGSPRVVSSAD